MFLFGTLAQKGERLAVNQCAIGSIPICSVRPAHYRMDERMRVLPRRKNKCSDRRNCKT